MPRPFTASTGAERTLSSKERIEHLEGLLDSLGLIAKKSGKGGGGRKLASESKAKNVGHLRELEKETEVRLLTLSYTHTLSLSPSRMMIRELMRRVSNRRLYKVVQFIRD